MTSDGGRPAEPACAHERTHIESDWLGVGSGSYRFKVCDACGEVIPGSGRFDHETDEAPPRSPRGRGA